jgi:hypothetical protein
VKSGVKTGVNGRLSVGMKGEKYCLLPLKTEPKITVTASPMEHSDASLSSDFQRKNPYFNGFLFGPMSSSPSALGSKKRKNPND